MGSDPLCARWRLWKPLLKMIILEVVGAHFSLIIPEEGFVYWFTVQAAVTRHPL